MHSCMEDSTETTVSNRSASQDVANFVPELLRVLVGILPNAAAGKLVTVTGTVVRATGTQPLITGMGFACGACGEEQAGHFVDGIYAPPGRCPTDGCRGKTFAPNRTSATSVDWRSLKLQVRGLLAVSKGLKPRQHLLCSACPPPAWTGGACGCRFGKPSSCLLMSAGGCQSWTGDAWSCRCVGPRSWLPGPKCRRGLPARDAMSACCAGSAGGTCQRTTPPSVCSTHSIICIIML